MTVTLELPEELEAELQTEAAELGLRLEEYLLRVLATGRIAYGGAQTGADLVSYWQNEGLVGTRPDITDSRQHARALRKEAETRERA